MTKKYRIKKEYLREDGCFAFGGSPDEESDTPDYLKAAMQNGIQIDMPQAVPTETTMPTERSVNPISMFASQAPAMPQMPEAAPQLNLKTEQPQSAQPNMGMQQPNMGGYESLLRKQGALEGSLAAKQAELIQNSQAQMQEMQAAQQKHAMEYEQQANAIAQELSTGGIDANRYFNSKSDLGKASTAIGLILGGIGGGLNRTGQNVALDFLNKNIDRDIEAQKADRQNKTSLLNQLTQKYGSQMQGEAMLRASLQAKLANDLAAAAAKTNDPLARNRAEQAIMAIKQQQAATMAPVIQERAINEVLQKGMNPRDAGINMSPELAKRAVPGFGLANDPETAKQLNQEIIPGAQKSMEALQRLQKMGFTDKFSLTSSNLAKSDQAVLIGASNRMLTGGGPLQESERELLQQVIADPTKLFTVGAKERLSQFQQIMQKDMQYRLKQAGLSVPQQQAAQEVRIQFKPKK